MKPVDKWLLKELDRMVPGSRPFWMAKYGKWFIGTPFPRAVPGITEYDPVSGTHFVIELIVQDEKGRFIPLDAKTINNLKRMKFHKIHTSVKDEEKMIIKEDYEKITKLIVDLSLRQKDFERMAKRLIETHTVDYGGT